MKKQRKHKSEPLPRTVMEARALGYLEDGTSDECENFLTPNATIITGYVDLCHEIPSLNPRLRVPFTAKWTYGPPEMDPEGKPSIVHKKGKP